MLLNNTAYSDSRVIGGKTGYIKASGNTLVTMAEDNGLRLVAVVLKDKNPAHYKDTESLLNFGFDNFESVSIADPVNTYKVAERLLADKIINTPSADFYIEGETFVTIPKGADLSDITVSYDYNIGEDAPDKAIARMVFRYDGVEAGSAFVLDDRVSDLSVIETAEEGEALSKLPVMRIIIIGVVGVVLLAMGTAVLINVSRARTLREQRQRRLARRKRRLMELNVSEEDFMDMVKQEQSRSSRRDTRRR